VLEQGNADSPCNRHEQPIAGIGHDDAHRPGSRSEGAGRQIRLISESIGRSHYARAKTDTDPAPAPQCTGSGCRRNTGGTGDFLKGHFSERFQYAISEFVS
jgi:hypothetical protein